eukprot:7823450-Prorocentrum_lima.AAC.1
MTHPQAAGIRQGCPLSPYLFILVMTALMEDVRADLRSRHIATQAGHLPGVHETEFLYADDTLC